MPRRRELHLVEERARAGPAVARPGEEQVPAGARDPDIEEPSFLLWIGLRPAGAERELAIDQTREEYGVELEALRAVVCEQVHAAPGVLGGEPPRELGGEGRDVAVGMCAPELDGERAH